MYPIIFSIGNLTIFSYGIFVALAFFTAIIYLSNQIEKSKKKYFYKMSFILCLYVL
jgi:prolipoprotein diacylglyceryltransferase